MCGVFGLAGLKGKQLSLRDAEIEALRDRLGHRGPDGAGYLRLGHVALAHRRLAVIDRSALGAQPMLLVSGSDGASRMFTAEEHASRHGEAGSPVLALVYNGELYNDEELRKELRARGVRFRSRSDTETVLRALEAWGTEALGRMRGMFALAAYDVRRDVLMLARDPLGIKSLYWRRTVNGEVAFSSEIPPLPGLGRRAKADLGMVSAYLTTIRTVIGERTLFEGVRAVRGGEVIRFALGESDERGGPREHRERFGIGAAAPDENLELDEACERVRAAVEESVLRHMRSDVPVCVLLSGGLDSTIVATLAAGLGGERRPRTYCAGAPVPLDCAQEAAETDLRCARQAARTLGTEHAEAHICREMFRERWKWMIGRLGVPLSTPNEVAIWAVADRLRSDGCIVTLSGEGADELFAGYDGLLGTCEEFVRTGMGEGDVRECALFEAGASAWIPLALKPSVLKADAWEALRGDADLIELYAHEFGEAVREAGGYGLEAHLRFQRRINLTGLLQRLDTATMLAGVEGRTPFADIEVWRAAASVPMRWKFGETESEGPEVASAGGSVGRGASAVATQRRSKLVLREAFRDMVPAWVLEREKASFPLPFQAWAVEHAEALRESRLARSLFADAVIEAVATRTEQLWSLAWPMINLSLWAEAAGIESA